MLVQTAARLHERLELAEGGDEKAGLPEEPLGAAIDLGTPLQTLDHQPLKVVHRAVTAAQLIVERQDLDDESWPQAEGRGLPLCLPPWRRG